MFAKFWAIQREQHGDKSLPVIYANTSNEFTDMQNHVKSFCRYIEEKHKITIDLHIVRGKNSFFDIIKTEGYPVASKKIARMIRDIRTDLKAKNILYSELEPYLDDGFKSTEYLRSLHLRDGVVLYLTGYTSKNVKCSSWVVPKKWRKLINAPFEISEKCCFY